MLRDGLIEEQLIFGVMIFDEGRGTTLEGKIKGYVSGVSSHITPHKRYGGVSSKVLYLLQMKVTSFQIY